MNSYIQIPEMKPFQQKNVFDGDFVQREPSQIILDDISERNMAEVSSCYLYFSIFGFCVHFLSCNTHTLSPSLWNRTLREVLLKRKLKLGKGIPTLAPLLLLQRHLNRVLLFFLFFFQFHIIILFLDLLLQNLSLFFLIYFY
jgi:hypothetical protein